MKQREPWIGFVHVVPSGPSPLGDNRGAFVNALALAADENDYRERVCAALSDLTLLAIEIRDVATVADYATEDRISDEMQSLADSLSDDEAVQFDTFHAYDEPDA